MNNFERMMQGLTILAAHGANDVYVDRYEYLNVLGAHDLGNETVVTLDACGWIKQGAEFWFDHDAGDCEATP